MKIYSANLYSEGAKYAIVVGRFNEFIGSKLLQGAIDALTRHGVKEEEIEVIFVPGAFEIPVTAKKLALSKKYYAIICLGAVIRGETAHFEYVAGEVSKGIAQTSLETGIPVIFGVITTENLEQAIERAGVKSGNKGYDAAITAIEMVNLFKEIW